jgi:hypothetical protein
VPTTSERNQVISSPDTHGPTLVPDDLRAGIEWLRERIHDQWQGQLPEESIGPLSLLELGRRVAVGIEKRGYVTLELIDDEEPI